MDNIYRNIPPEEIPWNIETPPNALVELCESGKVKPCKTIDMGHLVNYAFMEKN